MIGRVHRRQYGEQHLRGADVAGRALASNVLLACLQSKSSGGFASGINTHSDHASGHAAFKSRANRHEAGVRSTESERNSETLRRTDHDVCADFTRRTHQYQRQQIGGYCNECSSFVHGGDEFSVVAQRTRGRGLAEQNPKELALRQRSPTTEINELQFDSEWLCARGQYGESLRKHVGIHQEHRALYR